MPSSAFVRVVVLGVPLSVVALVVFVFLSVLRGLWYSCLAVGLVSASLCRRLPPLILWCRRSLRWCNRLAGLSSLVSVVWYLLSGVWSIVSLSPGYLASGLCLLVSGFWSLVCLSLVSCLLFFV